MGEELTQQLLGDALLEGRELDVTGRANIFHANNPAYLGNDAVIFGPAKYRANLGHDVFNDEAIGDGGFRDLAGVGYVSAIDYD